MARSISAAIGWRRFAGLGLSMFMALPVSSCSDDADDATSPDAGGGSGGSGGSGGTSGTGGGDSGRSDAPGPGPDGCVQPGDKGNAFGVGEYCSPMGGQCSPFPRAPLCLADAVPEEGQWFCTRLCTMNDQCGEGAFCLGTGRGSACVPNRCVDDAGFDAGGGGDASGAEASGDAALD